MDILRSESSDKSSSDDLSDETDTSWDRKSRTTVGQSSMKNMHRTNVLKQLYLREIGRPCKQNPLDIEPEIRKVKLRDILPKSIYDLNHIFLGLSKCGRFLLSYTFTTEEDTENIALNTVYKYRLHWWSFNPPQKSRKLSEVMLFDNQIIYSMLYIAICQWSSDYNHLIIYGDCFENRLSMYSQSEKCYLTITTVPSITKCPECSQVAASYGEEDWAASWDTCARFSCFKHSVTVHTAFDVASPFPKFEPLISLKYERFVVLNSGNQLHALSMDLEHVKKSRFWYRASESLEEPSNPASEFQIQQVGSSSVVQHPWLEDCDMGASTSAIPTITTDSNSDMLIDEENEEETCRLKRQPPIIDDRLWGNPSQELNITCGVMNPFMEGSQSSVTLRSPVQKTVIISSDEIKDKNHPSGLRSSLSPPKRNSPHGKPIELVKPLSPSSVPNKMAAEAEKAYEFTEDLPETACEKLSSFRRRRLADKKYEFCEEGEDTENIVPYQLHRRRESIRLRSLPASSVPNPGQPYELEPSESFVELCLTPKTVDGYSLTDKILLLSRSPNTTSTSITPPSPGLSPWEVDSYCSSHSSTPEYVRNHKRRMFGSETPTDIMNNPRSPSSSSSSSLSTDIYPLSQSAAACVDPESVHRPLKQNLSTKAVLPRKASQPDLVTVSEDASLPVIGDAVVEEAATAETHPSSTGRCTVQIKRRFVEVDDELMSVITDVEDDDLNECPGYHYALPLQVHGTAYMQLQMISNTKAEKLMPPCVLVTQKSFDVEMFCHIMAERLCKESGKKYWFCSDYDVEIIDVCPFTGDVTAFALMRVQAAVKPKGLTKSQRSCSQARQQYRGGCCFVWNISSGLYSVVYTQGLTELVYVDDGKPWNPARVSVKKIRDDLPPIPTRHRIRSSCNKPLLRGVSATRFIDVNNKVELYL